MSVGLIPVLPCEQHLRKPERGRACGEVNTSRPDQSLIGSWACGSQSLRAELAAVEAYLVEVDERHAELLHWVAEALEEAFNEVKS